MTQETQNQGNGKPRPAPAQEAVASALRGLVKLLGAIRFYPPGHPSLKLTARDTLAGFSPVLQGVESFGLQVRRDHFALGELKVGADNPQLVKFAAFLFMRRVQRLLILPDLTARDLWHFVQSLNVDPNELQKRGGLPEALNRARVSTIWVNELNLAAVLERKTEIDRQKQEIYGTQTEDEVFLSAEGAEEMSPDGALGEEGPADPDSPEARLAELLRQLQKVSNEKQRVDLLLAVPPLLLTNLNERGQFLVLQALHLVQRFAQDAQLASSGREAAQKVLRQSCGDELLTYLVTMLCSRTLADDQREVLLALTPALGESMAQRLLAQLCVEKEAATRRLLSEALIRQGRCALGVLGTALQDERWYVVRNAVAILGEIRDADALPGMQKTLTHDDLRVRREGIRAITRIGGSASLGVLLKVLNGPDSDLRRQAMLSLGALKNPDAVPDLLKFIHARDPRLKDREVKKDAIRALGEIGSPEALPPLAELLLRRRFWYRARHDELRAAAAAALGEIGDPAAREVLVWAVDDRSRDVARAAAIALKQLRKGGER